MYVYIYIHRGTLRAQAARFLCCRLLMCPLLCTGLLLVLTLRKCVIRSIYVYVCIYLYTHVYVYLYVCMSMCILYIHIVHWFTTRSDPSKVYYKVYTCMNIFLCICAHVYMNICMLQLYIVHWFTDPTKVYYGVALVSRIDKIIGLFCKRALQKRQYSAKRPTI